MGGAERAKHQKVRFLASDLLLKGAPQSLEDVCRNCLVFSVTPGELMEFTRVPIEFGGRVAKALELPSPGSIYVTPAFIQEIGKKSVVVPFCRNYGAEWSRNVFAQPILTTPESKNSSPAVNVQVQNAEEAGATVATLLVGESHISQSPSDVAVDHVCGIPDSTPSEPRKPRAVQKLDMDTGAPTEEVVDGTPGRNEPPSHLTRSVVANFRRAQFETPEKSLGSREVSHAEEYQESPCMKKRGRTKALGSSPSVRVGGGLTSIVQQLDVSPDIDIGLGGVKMAGDLKGIHGATDNVEILHLENPLFQENDDAAEEAESPGNVSKRRKTERCSPKPVTGNRKLPCEKVASGSPPPLISLVGFTNKQLVNESVPVVTEALRLEATGEALTFLNDAGNPAVKEGVLPTRKKRRTRLCLARPTRRATKNRQTKSVKPEVGGSSSLERLVLKGPVDGYHGGAEKIRLSCCGDAYHASSADVNRATNAFVPGSNESLPTPVKSSGAESAVLYYVTDSEETSSAAEIPAAVFTLQQTTPMHTNPVDVCDRLPLYNAGAAVVAGDELLTSGPSPSQGDNHRCDSRSLSKMCKEMEAVIGEELCAATSYISKNHAVVADCTMDLCEREGTMGLCEREVLVADCTMDLCEREGTMDLCAREGVVRAKGLVSPSGVKIEPTLITDVLLKEDKQPPGSEQNKGRRSSELVDLCEREGTMDLCEHEGVVRSKGFVSPSGLKTESTLITDVLLKEDKQPPGNEQNKGRRSSELVDLCEREGTMDLCEHEGVVRSKGFVSPSGLKTESTLITDVLLKEDKQPPGSEQNKGRRSSELVESCAVLHSVLDPHCRDRTLEQALPGNQPGTLQGKKDREPLCVENLKAQDAVISANVKIPDSMHKQRKEEVKIVPEFDNYVIIGEEGSGGYGTVYRVKHKVTGNIYAMKCPLVKTHSSCVDNEIDMLQQLGGQEFIIKYLEVVPGRFRTSSKSGEKPSECKSILLEFIEHDKPEVLRKEISVDELKSYSVCLFRALAHMHKQKITHLDIKPGNFLFSRSKKCGYLVDFNLARDEQQQSMQLSYWTSGVRSSRVWRIKKILPGRSHVSRTDIAKRPPLQGPAVTLSSYSKRSRLLMGASGSPSPLGTSSLTKTSTVPKKQTIKSDGRGVSADGIVSPPKLPDLALSGSTTPTGAVSSPRVTGEAPKLANEHRTSGVRQQVAGSLDVVKNHTLVSTSQNRLKRYLETKVYTETPPVPAQQKVSVPSSQRKRVAAVQNRKKNVPSGLFPEMPHALQPTTTIRDKAPPKPKGHVNHVKDGPCAGTKGYRAPEVVMKSLKQTSKVDMWSAGVSLLHLVSGRSPFPSSSTDGALRDIAKLRGSDAVLALATRHERPQSISKELQQERFSRVTVQEWCNKYSRRSDLKGKVPPEFFDLLEKCLDVDPDSRITAEEALKHQFCSTSL